MNFRRIDEGRYVLTDAELGIEFHVDRLRRERGELIGELTVACGILGAKTIDGVLSTGSFNYTSVQARSQRAKLLGERARTNGKVDWLERLEEVCQSVGTEERRGDPGVILADVRKPCVAEYRDLDVLGIKFPPRNTTTVFGDGGSGKSELVMKIGCELESQGIHVGYFDWELDESDQRPRLERISGLPMPPLRYVRCDKPLIYEVDRIKRIVFDDKIAFGIFDSAAYGCHGKAEDSDVAMEYFRVLRQLRIGNILIAHVTKGGDSRQNDQRPFGSTFWHNSSRCTWYLKRDSDEDGCVTIGAFCRKNNLGPPHRPAGIRIRYETERTYFERVDLATVPELAVGLSLKQRIRASIRSKPQTLAAIATELNANQDSIERVVRRHKDTFTRVSSADGITRIALVERQVS